MFIPAVLSCVSKVLLKSNSTGQSMAGTAPHNLSSFHWQSRQTDLRSCRVVFWRNSTWCHITMQPLTWMGWRTRLAHTQLHAFEFKVHTQHIASVGAGGNCITPVHRREPLCYTYKRFVIVNASKKWVQRHTLSNWSFFFTNHIFRLFLCGLRKRLHISEHFLKSKYSCRNDLLLLSAYR